MRTVPSFELAVVDPNGLPHVFMHMEQLAWTAQLQDELCDVAGVRVLLAPIKGMRYCLVPSYLPWWRRLWMVL